MKIFDSIRNTLINPNEKQMRRDLTYITTATKIISATLFLIGFVGGTTAFLRADIRSLTNNMAILCGIGSAVASLDVYIVAKNIEEMLNENIVNRVLYGKSAETFVKRLFKNTNITEKFIGQLVINELKKRHN